MKFNLTQNVYIIIDSSTYGVIEYCETAGCKYITDNSKVYYYNGPLSYYEASSISDTQIVDCKSREEFSKNNIHFKSKTSLQTNIATNDNFSSEKSSASDSSVSSVLTSTTATSSYLPYATKPYDTNNSDICGATAAAIMIEYYYSHIDSSVALAANITSDGQVLTDLLNTYIGGSATVYNLDYGLDDYLILSSLSASHVTLFNILTTPTAKMESCITNAKPCIIGLASAPTYGDHWVVATGFVKSIQFAVVNDGWGNTGINISYSYIDSCVYLS